MNLLSKIILAVMICFSSLNAQECEAKVYITTDSDEAVLFLGDSLIKQNKNIEIELPPGDYKIIIVDNVRKWDASKIEDTLIISDCNDFLINYRFNKQILLNSDPQNVYVKQADSLVGFTPLMIESGFSTLKLEKPNYTSVNLTSEEILEDQIPKLQFNAEPPKKEFYGSLLFNVLLGTAIALGAATAYYKIEADDLYEQYKITGDPGLIDNIDHYDDQSAGTLIGMELCIGALIYFFLTN